jgi:hypothetical protein
MSNNLALNGATAQKQTRWAAIATGRWSSGIWTNRSPLRDANTTRLTEKFYGPSGDALIAGLNVEVTNKLTLARRPGTSIYDNNSYSNVDRFYSFRLSNTTTEQIDVMVDQANALYSTNGNTKNLVFTKSTGAGQSYMQSVGNTLYFADGVDNRKWLQTLFGWTANTVINLQVNPFLTTFFIDSNGNMMQLLGTAVPIVATHLTAPTPGIGPQLTLTSSISVTGVLNTGDVITFPGTMAATWLEYQKATVTGISGTTITLQYPVNYLVSPGSTVEHISVVAINGGNPVTGNTQPVGPAPSSITDQVQQPNGTFSAPAMAFAPNFIIDNTAVWLNKGIPVETWGLDNSKTIPINPSLSAYNPNFIPNPQDGLVNWTASSGYGAGIFILDSNGNIQHSTSGGMSGTTAPSWATILGQTTADNTITWTVVYTGAISASNGGWKYCVALVNTLDNTVSNVSTLSPATGNINGSQGVYLTAGSGLSTKQFSVSPNLSIDTQTDYVAIFRTTDGQSVPFLIPGPEGGYTLSLEDYMLNGYVDTTPDTGLNNLISAPLGLENTIPQYGAKNLTYHLDRIFYSVGNVVYWTAGPDTPVGNGINGYIPATNFSAVSSLVTRLVPTPVGLFVFTVSDVYLIQGNGTTNNPLQAAVPILPGIGLPSYNALGTNGSVIGLFTTDSEFVTIDPSDSVSYVGFPIGDLLATSNGLPGTAWVPSLVYVTWHTEGEDQAWYVGDGQFGWYRLMTTPAPETGLTWSPYARINGGIKAIQSIETSPGVHRLMIGPTNATTQILYRDTTVFTDNLIPYIANATIGSCVLAQPGQVAAVAFVTTDSVKTGSPLFIGILVDEALPYYTGPIDYIKRWEYDPPGLRESQSLYSQRFYLSDLPDEAATMRHCQIQIVWSPTDTVQNELLSMTIFGSFYQEI